MTDINLSPRHARAYKEQYRFNMNQKLNPFAEIPGADELTTLCSIFLLSK